MNEEEHTPCHHRCRCEGNNQGREADVPVKALQFSWLLSRIMEQPEVAGEDMSLPSALLLRLPQEPLALTAVLQHVPSEKVKGDPAQLSLVSLFPQGWHS